MLSTTPISSGEYAEISSVDHSSHEGIISTATGERSVRTLSTQSKCAIVAFIVGGIAGSVIIVLGATHVFGLTGSAGFIGSIAGGGVLALFCTGGVICLAIATCKPEQGLSQLSSDEINTREDDSDINELRASLRDKMGNVYPQLGQEAIEFARQQLNEALVIEPAVFSAGWKGPDETNQPVNREIALLTTLYWDVYYKAFEQKLKQHREENPWSQPDVIQAADDLIKIGYAISCLTLEDLPEFTEVLKSRGTNRTYAEALTIQDSYQYRTYYSCTQAYHWIRGGVTWGPSPWWDDEEDLCQPRETPIEHADLFYQKGTIQYGWRMLYNDHCDRIRSYVKESDLQRADNRHFRWTQKDKEPRFGKRTFIQTPDTLPT